MKDTPADTARPVPERAVWSGRNGTPPMRTSSWSVRLRGLDSGASARENERVQRLRVSMRSRKPRTAASTEAGGRSASAPTN